MNQKLQNKIDQLWTYNVTKGNENWQNLVIILDQLIKFYGLKFNQEVLLSRIISDLTRRKYLTNEDCKKFIYLLSGTGLDIFECLNNIPDREKVLKAVPGFLEEEKINVNKS